MALRFAAETIPRSHTSTTRRMRKRFLRASRMGTSVFTSAVFPGQISQEIGIPSRRITTPKISCR